MLKERTTYEIMRPEDVGLAKTDLVLGKHSGRAALGDRARELGYHLDGEQLQEVFDAFKKLADKKKEIYDGDIHALIQQRIHGGETENGWSLVAFDVKATSGETPICKLTLARDGQKIIEEVAEGDGPIDAAFWAVEKITGLEITCKDYQVRSATLGRDAIGEVLVEIEYQGTVYRGRGTSTDTVESTIKAILDAVNRIES